MGLCFFCGESIEFGGGMGMLSTAESQNYQCRKCGNVRISEPAVTEMMMNINQFTDEEKIILSRTNRIAWEESGRIQFKKALTIEDMQYRIKNYHIMDTIDKMDNALLNLDKASIRIGSNIKVDSEFDYPYYQCLDQHEMENLFRLLSDDGFISPRIKDVPCESPKITTKGYRRIRELKRYGEQSNQCFLAMWFNSSMDEAYETIKDAIEYKEDDNLEPRFKAVRIDNVEHTNDINDEIIAQIRRSRFMVCDLTGYRGGVYFEAGFAHGLGIDVIYTCRKDWCEKDKLYHDNSSQKVCDKLYDSRGKEVFIQKEGVHFDLSHRNRIEWEKNNLDEFKKKLIARIKATII